jgi:alkylhydroperoxidase family enzyme
VPGGTLEVCEVVAARKAGMTEAMFVELMAVVSLANEGNRLAAGYRVPLDAAFEC